MKTGKSFALFVFIAAIIGFSSCSNDDDAPIVDPGNPQGAGMGSFSLPVSPLVGGTVLVENLIMPTDGWIVVRRDDGNNKPTMSEIISIPEKVVAGTYAEYVIDLEENSHLQQGEKLWVNLHDDDGDNMFNAADLPLGIFDPFSGYVLISDYFIVNLREP